MDRSHILETLLSNQPLFTTFPIVPEIRIGGDEVELGIGQDSSGEPCAEFNRLPLITEAGGKVYQDREHVEFCTPETSNAAARVAYFEAGKQFCQAQKYSPKLYCHNNDWQGHTFGSHENYFTCAPRTEWPRLIPFLIARTILIGAGWLVIRGGKPQFNISQRASFIEKAISSDTLSDRGIINTRQESLSRVNGFDRLHLICGDATMCEVSTFLRVGLTTLMIKLLERRAFPNTDYDLNKVVEDIRSISGRMSGWYLSGMTYGPKGAIELLSLYVRRAREFFFGQDIVIDAIILIAEDTLQKLASDWVTLFGRLDWVTKFRILEDWRASCPSHDTAEWLQSQDMEYHNLNQDDGLYYALRQAGLVNRIVSDKMIEHAIHTPPADTRAFVRGNVQRLLTAQGKGRKLHPDAWGKLTVIDQYPHNSSRITGTEYLREEIPNPFYPYRSLLEKIRLRIKQEG